MTTRHHHAAAAPRAVPLHVCEEGSGPFIPDRGHAIDPFGPAPLRDRRASRAAGQPIDDIREVSNYVDAMMYGLGRLEDLPLSLRLIREMHQRLLQSGRGGTKNPGEFRRSQNWIGGSRPGNALFVPPPPNVEARLRGRAFRLRQPGRFRPMREALIMDSAEEFMKSHKRLAESISYAGNITPEMATADLDDGNDEDGDEWPADDHPDRDLILSMIAARAQDSEFREEDHPRRSDEEFGSGGGAANPSAEAPTLSDAAINEEQRSAPKNHTGS